MRHPHMPAGGFLLPAGEGGPLVGISTGMISPANRTPARLQFPSLAEAAGFASHLLLGFLIDTRHCLLIARLTEDEQSEAVNRFHAKPVTG
ncbi:MAG: hypothetical protein EOP50_04040 [Sphingobacteriales bacterium]|nr:MAG: hypothetical protein EOP50_04040 [Sphingobacteriales bacterium]